MTKKRIARPPKKLDLLVSGEWKQRFKRELRKAGDYHRWQKLCNAGCSDELLADFAYWYTCRGDSEEFDLLRDAYHGLARRMIRSAAVIGQEAKELRDCYGKVDRIQRSKFDRLDPPHPKELSGVAQALEMAAETLERWGTTFKRNYSAKNTTTD